uniref:Uncharacterized protein n=1 Tax=Dunaliella tertiolecta TaxID=3047 RepID=A0A7S3VQB5_DUNTE|mmetsp:Transcript_3703/g.10014  ORF Transcript_3703/g.10014 Transcript_3703/m.10014 type:complete len:958 (+) Transcript_3703:183-3056(+)|eukprot:CAMPEP_0202410304 /NCGR_PEP_ID=MMETSP1128-20130828/18805_1 /ASSEMBLY_ACC=CAM_ASM_000463 /TAXON_ID=3047 /ORGANISM="Dunaliella tertiolecta, Strain CCMP1320" /LENGTH=957 /DNA_ID=CAMNT_0049015793 /DNA_START=101 /DNA_END=2974 /DNA_ORIENTATION=+
MPATRTSLDQPPTPPTDLPGVLNVLSQANDAGQIAGALSVLLDLKGLPTEEEPLLELVSKALPHTKLCHKDPRVRNACVRVLGRLITIPGILQSTLISGEVYGEGAWTCLMEFSDMYGAYKEAILQMETAPPAQEVKRGAAKVAAAPDPEAGLPGPSKFALEAALRTLELMLSRGPRHVLEWLVSSEGTMTLLPLVHLLGHHSSRVQMRAAQVIRMLCEYEGAKSRLVQASGVGALLREASKNLSGTVRVEVVQALHRLLSGPGMQHLDLLEPGDRLPQPPFDKPSNAQLEGKDGVQILLSLMLAPESGHARTVEEQLKEARAGGNDVWEKGSVQSSVAPSVAPTTAGGSGGKHGKSSPVPAYLGPPPLEFGRPQRSKPEDLQLAAASALVSSCTFCAASIERLVQLGGFQLLLALLPLPPLPDSEECFSPRENQSTGREDKKGAQGKGAQVPALAPITDLEEDDTQSCNSIAQALAAGEMRDLDWTTTLVSTTFELPFTKSLSTEVHVAVQRVLELVLTLPDVRATLHSHALAEQAASEARKAAAEEAAKAAEAAAKAEACGVNVATPPSPPQEKGGGSGTAGKGAIVGGKGEQPQQQTDGKIGGGDMSRGIRDRWGRPAEGHAVRLLGTLHEVLLFAFSATLPPPPRPSSENKRDKDAKKQQAAAQKGARPTMEEFGTTLEHMLPPFSQSVRAAAMACFVQLAKHEGYAMLFAGNSQMKALVGRLGRSDEAIVQQNLTEPARSTSPLGKGRAKAKTQSPTPPSSSGARGAQAAGRGQAGEADKDGQQWKDAKATIPPEPELVAPLASLLQLLIPYIATPAPPTEPAPAVAPLKPRVSKMLLGQSKAPVEPPSSQGARPAETGLIRPDVVHALKRISAAAHAAGSSGIVGLESVRLAVASAVLMLPESEFMVSARPPLPSPPPTPPPQPLATSVFLWDALDRPQMTDGSVKLVHIA